jgi:hypothetical protein
MVPRRANPTSASEDSPKFGFVRLATTLLQASLPWVTTSLAPTASEGRRRILAMPFFVFAVLAVLGTLVLVGVLYLLARRWL